MARADLNMGDVYIPTSLTLKEIVLDDRGFRRLVVAINAEWERGLAENRPESLMYLIRSREYESVARFVLHGLKRPENAPAKSPSLFTVASTPINFRRFLEAAMCPALESYWREYLGVASIESELSWEFKSVPFMNFLGMYLELQRSSVFTDRKRIQATLDRLVPGSGFRKQHVAQLEQINQVIRDRSDIDFNPEQVEIFEFAEALGYIPAAFLLRPHRVSEWGKDSPDQAQDKFYQYKEQLDRLIDERWGAAGCLLLLCLLLDIYEVEKRRKEAQEPAHFGLDFHGDFAVLVCLEYIFLMEKLYPHSQETFALLGSPQQAFNQYFSVAFPPMEMSDCCRQLRQKLTSSFPLHERAEFLATQRYNKIRVRQLELARERNEAEEEDAPAVASFS